MTRTLAEGMERAIAGDPGTPQDESHATYAAPFTEGEYWLDWAESGRTLLRKVTALNLFAPRSAKARIAGEPYRVERVEPLPDARAQSPGAVIARTEDGFVIGVANGSVRVSSRRSRSDTLHLRPRAGDGPVTFIHCDRTHLAMT